MSREATLDFTALREFIEEYRLNSSFSNASFAAAAKRMHKKLYGFLTFYVEASSLQSEGGPQNKIEMTYLRETGSDLGQALFCWIHGAYKPASAMLRSSIETYAKAITAHECTSILQEKSLFKVFDLVAASSLAMGPIKGPFFSRIRSEYTALCVVTHSASSDVLAQINALNTFPHFDETIAGQFAARFSAIVEMFLALLLSNCRILFNKMHFRNRAIVLDAVPKRIKGSILLVED